MAKMKKGDDPSNFDVSEVQDHLKNADEDEKNRVLEAERQGKQRKTIVGDEEEAAATGGAGDDPDNPPGGIVAAGEGEDDDEVAGPVYSKFKMPDTHDDAEKAAVERAVAKKI